MSEKAKIGTGAAISIGLGAIIGAGIFALSGTAIAIAGADAIIAFIGVGIVAIMVALQSSELVSLMPYAKGAAYSYVFHAFGSELGFVSGIISVFSFGTSISVIALSFGAYLASLIGFSTAIYSIPFAIALIFILMMVNLIGVRQTANIDYGLVLIKAGILMVFVIFAVYFALNSHYNPLSHFTIGAAQGGIGAIFSASVVIFFAYGGFQTINSIVSVVKGGAKPAIKAILLSVVISMVLYILVIVALLFLLPANKYIVNADPLTYALRQVGAPVWLFIIVGIGALIATASATVTRILGSSRLLYQMGQDRLLPGQMRSYNAKSNVAVNGVILTSAIGIVMLFSGNIFIIAAISNFGALFLYLMTSIAVIHFRRRGEQPEFKSPFYPYLPIISIIAILAFMYGMPRVSLVVGVVLILSLIIVYYSLSEVERKKVVRIRLFD